MRARAVKVEWSHEWLVPGGCALGAAVEAALRCAALSWVKRLKPCPYEVTRLP